MPGSPIRCSPRTPNSRRPGVSRCGVWPTATPMLAGSNSTGSPAWPRPKPARPPTSGRGRWPGWQRARRRRFRCRGRQGAGEGGDPGGGEIPALRAAPHPKQADLARHLMQLGVWPSAAVVFREMTGKGFRVLGGFRLSDGRTMDDEAIASARGRVDALPYTDPAKTPSENVLAILRTAARKPGDLDALLLSEVVERLVPWPAAASSSERSPRRPASPVWRKRTPALSPRRWPARIPRKRCARRWRSSWPGQAARRAAAGRRAPGRRSAARADRRPGRRGHQPGPACRPGAGSGPGLAGRRAAGPGREHSSRRSRTGRAAGRRAASAAARGRGPDGRGSHADHLEAEHGQHRARPVPGHARPGPGSRIARRRHRCGDTDRTDRRPTRRHRRARNRLQRLRRT